MQKKKTKALDYNFQLLRHSRWEKKFQWSLQMLQDHLPVSAVTWCILSTLIHLHEKELHYYM